MNWVKKPGTIDTPFLCKIGLHLPGKWKINVEPDFNVEVTLVVRRRYCERCKAMQYQELERHV